MYDNQIKKSIPDLRVVARLLRKVRTILPHEVSIQGSYRTGNVGDRAIGKIMKRRLTDRGHKTMTFERNVGSTIAPKRILGGGGVLHDWYGVDHLYTRLSFISTNGAIIGVGVPGFRTDEAKSLVSKKLRKVDLVTVRDDWSRKRLEPYYDGEIKTTACPTLLFTDPSAVASGQTGINFRPWFHLDKSVMTQYFDYESNININQAKKNYISNAKRICDSVHNPVFIPFHEDDERFATQHLDIEVLPYVFSVKKTLQRVSAVKKLVTTRYHSLVFGTVCNKPMLVIGYEPKVAELAERLNIPWFKPNRYIPVEFTSPSNRDSIRQSSRRNFSLLNEILNT